MASALLLFFVIIAVLQVEVVSLNCNAPRRSGTRSLTMKWVFEPGYGTMQQLGGIGKAGEYYFIPSKKPQLDAPPEVLGKTMTIPIFPRNNILLPLGEEYTGIYEMRYRQMLNDVGENGQFGSIYFSHHASKSALVGTIAKIKRIDRLEDGGCYATIVGVKRFYLQELLADKPYTKARVQVFEDYVQNEVLAREFELNLFEELRYSVKMMKMLYPNNNFTLTDLILQHRPQLPVNGLGRQVKIFTPAMEAQRCSLFTYAVMDMIKTDPVNKLVNLQVYHLEKRLKQLIKVLKESNKFLSNELSVVRGIVDVNQMGNLRADLLADMSDLQRSTFAKTLASPSMTKDNDFVMQSMFME